MIGLGGSSGGVNLPTYAGSRSNIFNGVSCYNFTAANTKRTQASLAQVQAGANTAEWLFIGDSLIEGSSTGGVYTTTNMWSMFLRQALAIKLGITANDGIVRNLSGPAIGNIDPRWAYVGAWTNSRTFTSIAGAGNCTLTTTNNGTNCYVWYFDAVGHMTISVNGAVAGAGFLDLTTGGTNLWKRVQLTGFAAANNVKITWVSGTIFLKGACIYNTGQLLIHNLGQGGSTAAGAGNAAWSDTINAGTPYVVYVAPQDIPVVKAVPDTVFIGLGVNDFQAGTASATVIAAIKVLVNAYPTSDVILVATQGLSTFSDATWTSFVTALYNLADSLNLPLFDIRNNVGSYTQANAAGYTTDGQGHFVPYANAIIANTLLDIVA